MFFVFLTLGRIFNLKNIPYKKYFLIFCGGLVIGIPYFISLSQSGKLPTFAETLARLGRIHTHFPSGLVSVFIIGLVTLAMLVLYRKKIIEINSINIFLFSGLLSGIIVMNQHLITGLNMEFSSHYLMGSVFWSAFVLIYLIHIWLRDGPETIKKIFMIITGVIVSLMAFTGFYKLVLTETNHGQYDVYIQNYAPVFDWLNQNAKLDDVVLADDEISGLIPIYTSQNVFYNFYSILFFLPNSEVEKRFIIIHYFDNFRPQYVQENERLIFGNFYIDQYNHNLSKNKIRRLLGIKETSYTMLPETEINRIVDKARIMQKNDFEKEIKTYRIDYLVWDSIKNPDWKINRFKFLKQVYSTNGIIIYKVN